MSAARGAHDLPRDAGALASLAALAEPPEGAGAPCEIAAIPALRWIARALGARRVARVGLGGGSALGALADAAEVLAAPWGEGEPGMDARGVARRREGRMRLVEGPKAARAEVGEESLDLLSLSAGAADALGEWAGALAPGGVVALDAPDPGAALAALGEAFGTGAPAAALGGVAVALPGRDPPRAFAEWLAGAEAAPLGVLLGRIGAGLVAEALVRDGPGAMGGALREARALAEARAQEATRARGRILAALAEVEAASLEADRLARLRAREDAGLRAAAAERERALHRAGERIAALEAEGEALRRRLAERFEEIALLTRERLEREGAS